MRCTHWIWVGWLVVFLEACATTPSVVQAPSSPPASAPSGPLEPHTAYLYLKGAFLEMQGDLEGAIEVFSQALEQDPDSRYLRRLLVTALVKARHLEEASQELEILLSQGSPTREDWLLGAQIYSRLQQSERALEMYRHLLELAPQDPEIHWQYGLLLARLKRYSEAVQAIRQGIRVAPHPYQGYYLLGRVYQNQGKTWQAARAYRKAVTLAPRFEAAWLALGSLYEKGDRWERAERIYREALEKLSPPSPQVLSRLLRLYQQHQVLDRGVEVLGHLLERYPENVDLLFRLSLVLRELQDRDQSIALMEQVVALRPRNLRLQEVLGGLLVEAQQWEKAGKIFEDILAQDPDNVDAHLNLAYVYEKKGEPQKAIGFLWEVVYRFPDRLNPYLMLGGLYLRQEDYPRAEKVYQRGIAHLQDPHDQAELYFNLGVTYDKEGRFEDMVAAMEKAIELNPRHANALNYLGYTYADRNMRLDEAIELIQRALEIHPDEGAYVDSLGWAYYRKGMIQEARKYLERAVELLPDDPVVREHLGDVYLRLSLREQAREEYLKALQLDRDNESLKAKIRENGLGDPNLLLQELEQKESIQTTPTQVPARSSQPAKVEP